jgi:hypothetical protein
MRKVDYTKAYRKKIIQDLVFDDFKSRGLSKIIGLAGPNITDYLTFAKSKGIKQAEIYEKDSMNLLYQIADFRPPIKTKVLYQDILHANVQENVLYDLDFTCTIKNAEQHIKKFKNNAIITLALRKIGLMPTLKKFCKLVSNLTPEITLNIQVNPNYKVHLVNFGKEKSYTVYQYFDTTPMCMIKPNF